MPSVTLGKAFAECFWSFAECTWHSANLLYPVVLAPRPVQHMTLDVLAHMMIVA